MEEKLRSAIARVFRRPSNIFLNYTIRHYSINKQTKYNYIALTTPYLMDFFF